MEEIVGVFSRHQITRSVEPVVRKGGFCSGGIIQIASVWVSRSIRIAYSPGYDTYRKNTFGLLISSSP